VQVEVGVISAEETSSDVVIRIDDIHVRGLRATGAWTSRADEGLGESTLTPPSPGGGRFHLPQILMPAAWPDEFEKRYGEPGTPANIAQRVKFCIEMAKKGKGHRRDDVVHAQGIGQCGVRRHRRDVQRRFAIKLLFINR
jgi:hypothetical protein